MTNYSQTFDTPAPIANITLRNVETGERTGDVSVLLDTGADISLLPLSAIRKLKIELSGETVDLIGFDESKSTSEIYRLQVIFLGKRFTGDYCAIDGEIGILGRDVFNEFSTTFDGKSLEWKEEQQ